MKTDWGVPFLDIHVHVNPDIHLRRYDPDSLGLELQSTGSGAVMKSHHGSTIKLAKESEQNRMRLFGSIVMNGNFGNEATNLEFLKRELRMCEGPVVIWFPTVGAEPDSGNRLIAMRDMKEIVQLASDVRASLATGHLGREDIFRIAEESDRRRCNLMLTHPAHPTSGLNLDDIMELTKSDYIWAEVAMLMLDRGYQTNEGVQCWLNKIGQGSICISSDYGQMDSPSITSGYRDLISKISSRYHDGKGVQISEEMIREMVLVNPASFLHLGVM